MTRSFFAALLLVALAACGGGEHEESVSAQSMTVAVEQRQQVAAQVTAPALAASASAPVEVATGITPAREAEIRPTISRIGFDQFGYPQVRLVFGPSNFGVEIAPGDQIVWHSGMIHANQPAAPRGEIKRDGEGRLYADISLYYALDRGIFAAVSKGKSVDMANGQPKYAMNVAHWKLSDGWKTVDVGYDRIWLDISFH